jgi:hypothetical protein
MAHRDSGRWDKPQEGAGSKQEARDQSRLDRSQLNCRRRFAKGDKILTVHNKANFQPDNLEAARRRSSTTAALAAYPNTASANR